MSYRFSFHQLDLGGTQGNRAMYFSEYLSSGCKMQARRTGKLLFS